MAFWFWRLFRSKPAQQRFHRTKAGWFSVFGLAAFWFVRYSWGMKWKEHFCGRFLRRGRLSGLGVGLWLIWVADTSSFKSKPSFKIAQHCLHSDVLPHYVSRPFFARRFGSVSLVGSRGNTPVKPAVGLLEPEKKRFIIYRYL